MRRLSVRAVSVLAGVLTVAGLTAAPAAARSSHVPDSAGRVSPSPVAGSYVALPEPSRVVDTRTGAAHNRRGALHAGRTFTATVAGRGAVPRRGVGAVLVSVTAVRATASGALVVYGGRRPRTTNLQFARGRSATDTAVVPLSRGRLHVHNAARRGRVDVLLDVLGYYRAGHASATQPGAYHSIRPRRVVDTRSGTGVGRRGPLRAHRQITPTLAGTGHGIPAGAGSVAITVTVLGATRPGAIRVSNPGDPRTGLATVQFARGQAVSSFTVVGLSDGRVRLQNDSTGRVQLLVDVAGWYSAGIPEVSGALRPLPGARVATERIGARHTTTVPLAGRAGVPLARVAAVLVTLHAVNPRRSGSLQVWRAGARRAPANAAETFTAHRTSSNTLLVPVSRSGRFAIRNLANAQTRVDVDVRGYVPANDLPGPGGTGLARYPNELQNDTAPISNPPTGDANYMLLEKKGCADANSGANFVLLDIGAQSVTAKIDNKRTGLSQDNPGVAVAQTGGAVHLDYPHLVAAIEGYIDGYDNWNCNYGTSLTLAVGTNNDGEWNPKHVKNYYAPRARGADWATKVINPLNEWASAKQHSINVVGADDIEAAFASTLPQALAWENAYLNNTGAQLIYNGDANNCPASFGVTGKSCAYGWTQSNYYALAHRDSRIKVLPQVFFRAEAVKWANIDATGDASGHGHLQFLGSLTEHALVPDQLTPTQGRAALYRALSSVVRTPSVPFAVDIDTDS
ncbi:MAG TPA: hypothetical protein VFH38_10020 [Jatrophihabitans sp.]|nr:hypothetical protein [Jatrophihabitans sp.]